MEWTVSRFVNTSVDDCYVSLHYTTVEDLPLLREALKECSRCNGFKTKALHIARRIKKLEKGSGDAK